MRIKHMYKVFLSPKWYIRFDPTVYNQTDVLLGFNYREDTYTACIDKSMKDCAILSSAEFQIGFLIFTIGIGKEIILARNNGTRTKIKDLSPPRNGGTSDWSEDEAGLDSNNPQLSSNSNEGTEGRVDRVQSPDLQSEVEAGSGTTTPPGNGRGTADNAQERLQEQN